MPRWIFLSCLVLSGCFQAYLDDDPELRTVPVTNNPTIVPNHGGGIPGIGGGGAPY